MHDAGRKTQTARRIVGSLLVVVSVYAVSPASPANSEPPPDPFHVVEDVLALDPQLRRDGKSTASVELVGDNMVATVQMGLEDVFSEAELEALGEQADTDVFDSEVKLERVLIGQAKATEKRGAATAVGHADGGATVVEGFSDGLRMYEVIPSRNAFHRFVYTVTVNGEPASFIEYEGEILVGRGDKSDFVASGQIDAPWAVDANGQEVGVSYQIIRGGSQLVLEVDKVSTSAYPIVADPSYRRWVGEVHCSWGSCTFYLERVKTSWIRNTFATHGFAVGGALVSGSLCTWVGAVTFAIGGIVCGVVIASQLWQIQHHSQGWVCLTLKKNHWSTTGSWNHVSGSHSRCHYDI